MSGAKDPPTRHRGLGMEVNQHHSPLPDKMFFLIMEKEWPTFF